VLGGTGDTNDIMHSGEPGRPVPNKDRGYYGAAERGKQLLHGGLGARLPLMSEQRIDALRRMVEKRPDDARARFGLAAEYEKAGRWEDVVRELEAYLAMTDDEGNAWGRLGRALRELGRDDDARAAWQRGIEAAGRHGHPSMAAEFEEILEDM
jgi:tetratricopeptide (TPR) repeat protein